MPEQTLSEMIFYAVRIDNKYRQIPEGEVKGYKPESLQTIILRYEEPSVDHEAAAGREVARQGLISPTGIADNATVSLVKGLVLAQQCVKEWNVTTTGGEIAPVNPGNIKALLPRFVLREFGTRALFDRILTDEELAQARF